MGEHVGGTALHLVGHPLHVVRTAQRISHVGHTGLVGNHLLGTQRNTGRPLAGKCEGLIVAVGVEALGATHHAG